MRVGSAQGCRVTNEIVVPFCLHYCRGSVHRPDMCVCACVCVCVYLCRIWRDSSNASRRRNRTRVLRTRAATCVRGEESRAHDQRAPRELSLGLDSARRSTRSLIGPRSLRARIFSQRFDTDIFFGTDGR